MNGLPPGFRLDRSTSQANSLPQGFTLDPAPEAAGQAREPGFLAFGNRGIADTLGAPVDLVNAGLGLVGLGSETPFGGSEAIARGMRRFGVDVAESTDQPDTVLDYAGQGFGGATGALLPGAGAVALAARSASPLAQGVAATVSRPFLATPGRALAAEGAAGVGAGVGEGVADRLSEGGGLARTAGALVGGVAGGMGPSAAARMIQATPIAGTAIRTIQGEIAPFTEAGAMERARRRVGGLVEDRATALQNLQDPAIADLSPAVRSGDRRLMALEGAVRAQEPKLDATMRGREVDATQTLRDEFLAPSQGASGREAREFIGGRVETLVGQMNERASQARQRAQERIAALAPGQRQSQASIVVRDELEAAHADARSQERSLWQSVPRNQLVPTEGARRAYADLAADLPRAQRDDMPAAARTFLEDGGNETFRSQETVKEVHGLYSALRQEARAARAGDTPNANRARLADRLADSLLEDMNTVSGASAPLREALTFSREVNRTFRQGSVGRVIGSERTGADRVPAEMTLDATIGRPGARGGVGMDEMAQALGPRDASGPMRDYVLGRFDDAAVRDGALRQGSAESFMRSNRDVLERMPQTRDAIGDAMVAGRAAERTDALMGSRAAAIQNPRQSAAARMMGARPGEELRAILQANDPRATAAQLVRQARRDDSGRALAGLKGAVLDDLIAGARTGQFDEAGEVGLSGRAIMARLSDPQFSGVAGEILNPAELTRAQRIAEELRRVETMQGRLPGVGPIMGDEPNSMVAYLARVVAARSGARMGQGTSGASLQTAQMASARMQRVLNQLTNDKAEQLIIRAIGGDEDLFTALLTDGRSLSQRQENRIIETIMGVLGQSAAGTREPLQITVTPGEPQPQEEPTPLGPRADASPPNPLVQALMNGTAPMPMLDPRTQMMASLLTGGRPMPGGLAGTANARQTQAMARQFAEQGGHSREGQGLSKMQRQLIAQRLLSGQAA